MIKQRKRDEIKETDKWDLTLLYKNEEEFNKDYDKAKVLIEKLSTFTDMFESLDRFKEYLKTDEEVDKLLNTLGIYVHCMHDQDTSDKDGQRLYQLMNTLYQIYTEKTSFVSPLILETDEKIIDEFLSDKDTKKYRRVFDKVLRYKKHHLSQEQERVVSALEQSLEAASEIYFTLTDTDLTFGNIKDENDKEVELTESNFSKFMESSNRRVREESFKQLLNTYKKYSNTIANAYINYVNKTIALTKLYNFDSSLEKALYADNIDKKVYETLINSVSNSAEVINHYFKALKEALNVEELHRYDIYAKVSEESNSEYKFEEAKELVINALEVLGSDYNKILNKAFDERWIDIYNNKGKRGGAYSTGNCDTVPYLLLNYEGRLNDVSTLAHELGHSLHTYYSCHNNDRIYSSYKIFVAEVASTTNELLLNDYLLEHAKTPEEKLPILANLIKLYYATIIRQTMFADFEKQIFEKREQDIPLTHEDIENIYYELCKKYFKDEVILDEEIKYEWSRIPHFYYGFYVYKYATSLAASTYIAEKLKTESDFKEKYLSFLKSGDSMDPLDELKLVDIEFDDSKVIDEALNKFDKYITEFEKVLKETKRK